MKAYVITTGTVFGLLTLAHISQIVGGEGHLVTDPVFVIITVLSASLCAWAVGLLRRSN